MLEGVVVNIGQILLVGGPIPTTHDPLLTSMNREGVWLSFASVLVTWN